MDLHIQKNKTSADGTYIWVCERRKECKERIWTDIDSNKFIKMIVEHAHVGHATRGEILSFQNSLNN